MSIKILEKNLLILASAGSGKTYQLANRVIGLVGAHGVDPERIVALTFTRKAAGEFADSVLSKLGEAVLKPKTAARLAADIGRPVDVLATLERVVRALPRFQLGTMDGFFARVVRAFQYELGLVGGNFELVQGPRLEAALADIIAGILGNALEAGEAEEFLHAFQRATAGREAREVAKSLGDFFGRWHGLWKAGEARTVMPLESPVKVGDWEEKKHGLVAALRLAAESKQVAELLDALEAHTIGSGLAKDRGKTLFERMIEALPGEGAIEVKFGRGTIGFDAPTSQKWRELLGLLVDCELAAAVERTAGVLELVARYDAACERQLRRRGRLGFDDVKVLMGAWAKSEKARLCREAVDFRLDGRYDHWLLDEFQDTSQAEWRGIETLLDEAAMDDQGTLFVVGDVKQAIYGWRGGDVRLFDEVRRRFAGGLEETTMPRSWRSCPEVLKLVNRVCGDRQTIAGLFGEAVAGRWLWEDHEAAKDGLVGESRVEVIEGDADDRYARMIELMKELGIGRRELSCGVLVRTNDQLTAVAERLREEGFEVIEEGVRKPTQDNPVGVALAQLVAWLADPADAFARGVVRMSRLEEVLGRLFADEEGKMPDWRVWDGLMRRAGEKGFAGMLEEVVEGLWDELSEFGRRRAGDVIGALAAYDAGGGVGAREARRWIEKLEISQSPGTAAVQVMTVHKSKGLGFDIVILPEIEDKQVPNAGRFEVAKGDGWLLQPPAQWVRDQVPRLREAVQRWSEAQRYEAMCVLYVALTRAKRGLYLLLPKPPKNRGKDPDFASPTNWILRALGDGGDPMWQAGDSRWIENVPSRREPEVEQLPGLAAGVPQRPRTTPSGEKRGASAVAGSAGGRAFGTAVHECFERVGWVDDETPDLPDSKAGRRVAELLEVPELRAVLSRGGREATLFREQPVEAILDGKWLSGVIDRMHVLDGGARIELIDFKTDAVESEEELRKRYTGQMAAYRRVAAEIYPQAEVRCLLLGVRLAMWVEVPGV